jgi:hypothetical protein
VEIESTKISARASTAMAGRTIDQRGYRIRYECPLLRIVP